MTDLDATLSDHKRIWDRKPALRAVYRDYYRRLFQAVPAGLVLEVGTGSGNIRDFSDNTLTIDIQHSPWVDAVADAQALPFADGLFAGIILVDVLHHMERPRRFFDEVSRVLRPGGRCALVEPAITPVSRILFGRFHHEPMDFAADPLSDAPASGRWEAWDANLAIPDAIFRQQRERFAQNFPALRIVDVHRFDWFAYPLTGGFREWSLMPSALVGSCLALERALNPLLAPLMALRLMVVLERKSA